MDIFKLVGSVYVDTDKANESLSKTGEQAETTGSKLGSIASTAGKVAIGLGTACAAGAAALMGVATSAAESLDEVQKGAQKLSISYEEYQKLSYACDRSGTSIDNLSKGIKNITDDLADAQNGVEGATESYDALGISLQNADGSFKSSEEVLNESLLALADMEDETQRNALANDIFGKSYQDMLPLLNSGAEGIQELMQNAEDLGLVMSDEAVDAGANFDDMLDDVKDSFSAITTQIGAEVMPIIMELLQWVIDHMPEIKEVVGAVFEFIEEMIPVIEALIKTLQPVVQELFNGIKVLWNTLLKPVLDAIVKLLKGDFKGAFTDVFNAIGNTVKTVFNNLIGYVKAPLNTIIGYINRFINGLNSIKIPDWVPVVGGASLNIANIPLLAKGGHVLDNGSAIVGEAGAELVDLPSGATVTPLNSGSQGGTELLDTMRAMLEEMQALHDDMPNAISAAMNQYQIKFNDREMGRLVNKYA